MNTSPMSLLHFYKHLKPFVLLYDVIFGNKAATPFYTQCRSDISNKLMFHYVILHGDKSERSAIIVKYKIYMYRLKCKTFDDPINISGWLCVSVYTIKIDRRCKKWIHTWLF